MSQRSRIALCLLIALAILGALAPAAMARKPIISYLDAQESFQLYDVEAGANISPAPPVPVPKEGAAQFRWGMSSNGRYILFNDADKKLHLLDRINDQQVPLPGIDVAANPGDLTVSDAGLIAFDENQEVPTYVYDSGTKQFVDIGIDANPSEPTNDLRQPRLSGDGNFMVNTCFDDEGAMCETTKDGDSDAYVHDLVAKLQVPDFPDQPEGEGLGEEHPCINGDGTLIAVERSNPVQTDIFLFQRSGNEFSALETPGLNDPEDNDRYCGLSADGAYISNVQNDVFKLYERSSESFLDLPELPFDQRSTLSEPLVLPVPISGPAGGNARRCGGKAANLVGTAKRDRIKGTRKRDVIAGLGGNDLIRGLGGNDIICGEKGMDRLVGGRGRDVLLGGAGKDVLLGGKGRDRLRGGAGKDRQRQ
jgi:hypothetical protein